MKNTQKFKNFLESIKGNGQDVLIESVKKGFQACFESESNLIPFRKREKLNRDVSNSELQRLSNRVNEAKLAVAKAKDAVKNAYILQQELEKAYVDEFNRTHPSLSSDEILDSKFRKTDR